MTPTIQVYLNGVRAADGSNPNEPATAPFVVEGLSISWGRDNTLDQPAGDVCSFTMARRFTASEGQLAIFNRTLKLGVRVDVDAGSGYRVFTGQVTSVALSATGALGSGWIRYDIVADDALTDLSNRPSGTDDRPVETVSQRANYVLTDRGVPITMPAATAAIRVKAYDADADSGAVATAMLQELAISAGATLWSTTTSGGDPALLMESPDQRPALRRLAKPASLVVIVIDTNLPGLVTVDGCIPDLDPVSLTQTMDDLVTSCAITYYDETATYAAKVVLIRDYEAESIIGPYGVRRASLDSQLVALADATTVATALVARLHDPTWKIQGVQVDDALDDASMRALLTARTRIGKPLKITHLPWMPDTGQSPPSEFVGYVEGGSILSEQGVWSTELNVAAATSYAGMNARWSDLNTSVQAANTWQWQQFDPDMTWLDLQGVAGPA